jgi:hypothetical protein
MKDVYLPICRHCARGDVLAENIRYPNDNQLTRAKAVCCLCGSQTAAGITVKAQEVGEKRAGTIHYAKLHNSPRLQRLHALLNGGQEFTTLEIMQHAKICAVSASITELRRNGFDIACKMIGRGVYSYRMEVAQ